MSENGTAPEPQTGDEPDGVLDDGDYDDAADDASYAGWDDTEKATATK